MQAILIAILCSVAMACAGRTTETNTSPIPDKLVGEWRNSNDPKRFGAIFLLPDGRGIMLGSDEATLLGFKFVATYNRETHVLTVTTLTTEMEGGPKTFNLQYDPNSGTIKSPEVNSPFTWRSPEIHPNIMKQLE
jgi:hypothetical protein